MTLSVMIQNRIVYSEKQMPIRKGQVIDLDITGIAFGGKGLARIDGLAVFVDQVTPMDRARVRIIRKRRRHAEARLLEVISASPDRVEAPCPYSGTCGGCKWQFIDYERQLEFKRQHVVECLEHIGGLEGIPVHPTLPSAQIFGYRNKMEFTCSDRRWLMPHELGREGVSKDFALGLHAPGTFDKVLDIDACLLQPEQGNVLLADIRNFIRASGVAAYGIRKHTGFWRFVMLRHSPAHDRWMVNIVTAAQNDDLLKALAERLTAKYPRVQAVVNNITARKAGIAVGEREILLAGQPFICDKIGTYEFEISANSFFQTNTAGAETLIEIARGYAGLQGDESVLDLYCGTGTIAIGLSRQAREIVGIELVESAVADAGRNCRRNQVTNCRFIQGDILQVLPGLVLEPQVVVIDPPRAGMHKKVVGQVLELRPPRIVYVSCNPATLARDLEMMKQVYRVVEVQPVDMFPHTFHIESVARLERFA